MKTEPFLPAEFPEWHVLVKRLQTWYTQFVYMKPTTMLSLTDGESPEGEFWGEWCLRHDESPQAGDPWKRGWWSGRPHRFLALSLTLSIAQAVNTMSAPRLTLEAMQGAERLIEWAEPGVQRIFEEIGGSKRQELRLKALSKLASCPHGKCDTIRFHRKVAYHTDSREGTEEVMQELTEAGLVRRESTMIDGEAKDLWSITREGWEELR
jgi:hypothetical protein